LGHATAQLSQAQQQIYNRMAQKEKNQGVATVQSKNKTLKLIETQWLELMRTVNK